MISDDFERILLTMRWFLTVLREFYQSWDDFCRSQDDSVGHDTILSAIKWFWRPWEDSTDHAIILTTRRWFPSVTRRFWFWPARILAVRRRFWQPLDNSVGQETNLTSVRQFWRLGNVHDDRKMILSVMRWFGTIVSYFCWPWDDSDDHEMISVRHKTIRTGVW